MTATFLPEAEAEFNEAIDGYQAIDAELSAGFILEVEQAVARADRSPFAWSVLRGPLRRCLVHRFPYGVVYEVGESGIVVLAVMHLRRRPGYWEDRASDRSEAG